MTLFSLVNESGSYYQVLVQLSNYSLKVITIQGNVQNIAYLK